MTFLHLLAWLGGILVALIILAGVVIGIRVLCLGVQDRRHPVLEDGQADDEPIVRSRFAPYVPKHQPHSGVHD